MMINVVHISTVHPRRDTRIFYRECLSLVRNGCQVYLIVADGKGNEHCEGIQILDLGKQNSRASNFLKGYTGIKKEIKKINPSLVHFHDPELMFVGRSITKMGIPVVFDIHENIAVQIFDKNYIPKLFRKPISFIYRGIENFLIKKFHLIIAEHSYNAVYLNKGKSLTTVLNMPDTRHFAPYVNIQREGNEIFYIGVVSNERGLDITIKALQILNERGVDFYMHYIGPVVDKVDPNHLENIRSKIKFYGRMDSKEGFEISKKCIVGLSVLKPIKNYVGSYSTKIFEYMAIGLPVITSNFKLYKDVVEKFETGYCVDPYSAEELADSIQTLIASPSMSNSMGVKGIKAVTEQFNWSSEEKNLLALYSSLI